MYEIGAKVKAKRDIVYPGKTIPIDTHAVIIDVQRYPSGKLAFYVVEFEQDDVHRKVKQKDFKSM